MKIRPMLVFVVALCTTGITFSADKPAAVPKIPSGSKIYVAPMGGFENFVIAGIQKKQVPVTIVADRDKADYEIKGGSQSEKANWSKMLFLGSQASAEQASVVVRDIKSDEIVYAYSVNKMNSARGQQSTGEAIGKHLKSVVGKD